MGLFGKLFKGPEVDQEKSENNKKKMRALFDQVVENGAQYKLLACYTRRMYAGSIMVWSTAAKVPSPV